MGRKAVYIYSVLISLVFLAGISAPLTVDILNLAPSDTISWQENRQLAGKPDFILSNLDPFPSRYEKFYNDHFPFRYSLMNFQIREIRFSLLKQIPDINGLYVGKKGWLFLEYERPYWDGSIPFTRGLVDSLVKILHDRTLAYRARGIRFYILIPPMKCDIYPEMNPTYYYRKSDSVFTDFVAAALKRDTAIRLVWGKEILLRHKEAGLLYHLTDNHWNFRGAYYAYRDLADKIHRDFPAVQPLRESQFTFVDSLFTAGNLVAELGLRNIYTEVVPEAKIPGKRSHPGSKMGYIPPPEFRDNNGLENVYEVEDPRLPTAIVIHDSYGAYLVPFLSENFKRTEYLFDGWYYGPNWEMVEKVKPDLVILEIFSPHLKKLLRWK
ncbi:MAG TPA: hypothetical protein VMC08_09715 [Bacteroidales bacterium]|nr:hypothetical protein [Bacteroidales bacterium]